MPSGVRKKGSRWEIYDKNTGRHVGYSDTKAKALAAARHRDAAHKRKAGKGTR